MLTWLKKSLGKIAAGFVAVAVVAIVADAIQHYAILKFTENWLRSSSHRQNTFEIKLNLLPLGDASVEILNLVSKEKDETLTVQKIHLRKNLFDFSKIHLIAEAISCDPLMAENLTAVVERISNESGTILTFNPVTVTNFSVVAPVVNLTSEKIIATSIYKESDSTLNLDIMAPKISVNQAEALGLQIFGDLTIHKPHTGELTFKIKGIEEFSQILVKAGYLDSTKAQILSFGGMLLGDDDGKVRLKVRFKDNGVFLGPIKLR